MQAPEAVAAAAHEEQAAPAHDATDALVEPCEADAPLATNNNEEEENNSSDDEEMAAEEDEEEELDYHFANDAEAEAARQVGLKAYNEGHYEAALDQQYRVVRYFSEKYGATAAQCGKYFLDYGLSQLRLLQSQSSLEDALAPRDQDALETCYINLQVARVCLQKQEAEKGDDDVETELAIAEVHNALAQLNIEKEDFDAALREYEAELLLYRSLQQLEEEEVEEEEKEGEGQGTGEKKKQEEAGETRRTPKVPPRRIFSVLYGIADCYMKEADFDGAAERLQATLDEIARYPAGTIEPELIEELKDLLADANEMKNGKYKELQEVIQQQFAPEADSLPTAQEFYDVGGNEKHPFLSSLPGGMETSEASHLSMPMSATGQVLGLNEHSNSQSISLFPPQGSSRSHHPTTAGNDGSHSPSAAAVHVVMARKKPKTVPPASHPPQTTAMVRSRNEAAAVTAGEENGGPASKRVKVE